MKAQLRRRMLLPMILLVLLSIPAYAFTFHGIRSAENVRLAKAFAVKYDGKSAEDFQHELDAWADVSARPPIHVAPATPAEAHAITDSFLFKTSTGEFYRVHPTQPEFHTSIVYLWVPAGVLLVIAFGLAEAAGRRIQRKNLAPVGEMVQYLKELLAGHIDESGNPDSPGIPSISELEGSFGELLGGPEDRIEFQKAIAEIRENELLRRQFSANVSHELKSPLTSINGYAEMIESGMTGPEDTKAFAGIIRREGVRLLQMINEIIQLSKFDTGYSDYDERKTFDLADVILEEMRSAEQAAEDRNVRLSFDGHSMRIFGNQRLLADVVRNLISNAIKYSKPEGGHVEVGLREDGDFIEMTVRDDGIGIDPVNQERVFERFFVVEPSRTKNGGGGTGLGLSLVKHAVKAHNGTITLKSRLGDGCLFTVRLPKKSGGEPKEEPAEAPAEEVKQS